MNNVTLLPGRVFSSEVVVAGAEPCDPRDALDAVLALRPVQTRLGVIGLSASNVLATGFDELTYDNGKDDDWYIAYDRIGVLLVGAVQRLEARVRELEARPAQVNNASCSTSTPCPEKPKSRSVHWPWL